MNCLPYTTELKSHYDGSKWNYFFHTVRTTNHAWCTTVLIQP